MNHCEINFEILRNNAKKIIGIQLIAEPQTEAEYFCAKFPRGLMDKKSDIQFNDGKMILTHETEGEHEIELNESDLREIHELLNGSKKKKLEKTAVLTPGFRIILDEEE